MRILVFGAGAIGSGVGGFLSQRGHEVIFFGRASHLSIISKKGLLVDGIFGRHRFRNFKVCTNLKSLHRFGRNFDLILLTVKTFDTQKAAQRLKSCVSRKTVVLSLQNGLGNIETLHRYIPKKQVLAARIIFGVIKKPGKIKITVWGGNILIGETATKEITSRAKQLATLFTDTGLKAQAVRDVRQHIWGKVIYNCALNPLASLLNTHYGTLLNYKETRKLMYEIIKECYQVAKKEGITLIPKSAAGYRELLFKRLIPDTYDHQPSMLFDLKRRQTEIDSLNGAITQMGKRFGVPTPVNGLITDLIKLMERK